MAEAITLQCPRKICGKIWTYTGASRWRATCPKCGTSVRFGRGGKADAAADYGAEVLLVPDGQVFQNGRIEIEGVEDIDDLADRIITG